MGSARGRGGVQAVERAFDLLEVLATNGDHTGVSELRDATGLPYATIHRLLGTLVAMGYARHDPGTRKYSLGARLVPLGDSASRLFGLWAGQYLAELEEASGETANLAVLSEHAALYVAQVPSRHRMRMFTEVGNRVPPHATAVGKVLLAFRPREVARATIARVGLPARTPNTITDPNRFLAELDAVAERGFAIDDGEEEVGVRCVAVPVPGAGGSVAAMSVSGPASRLTLDTCERLAPRMRKVADALSKAFTAGAPAS